MENPFTDQPLSAVLQSDLLDYHARLVAGGDEPIQPRHMMARMVAATVDMRAAVCITADMIVELIDAGHSDLARDLAVKMADRHRDAPGNGGRTS